MTVYGTELPTRGIGRSFYATVAPFPIACFVLTFLTDCTYWATASYLWETMSVWLLMVGVLVGAVAVLAGLVDLVRARRVRGLGVPLVVIAGHAVAFGLSIVNLLVHSRDGYTAVVPQGIALSALVIVVLLVTTYVGRPMAYRTRVGGLA